MPGTRLFRIVAGMDEDRQQPTFIQRRVKSQTTSANVERDVSAMTGFEDR